ncbi:hypothetical protein GPECTOR_88g447 [Gonium pectorale]|uniref:SCP domain-containing protein n=1 Tax=Gonium pectorale TaxID=33097 RepID=A0A150G0Z0_GONPE|nr:hypothetical protein GPECTOR_88g447 [Gonium pectorale]|eukprot:KXZ43504.1 hypothetical protein GPECTOR_88g447 [Gonium pectorale]
MDKCCSVALLALLLTVAAADQPIVRDPSSTSAPSSTPSDQSGASAPTAATSTPETAYAPSSSGLSSYAQQALDRHNMYRPRHRAPYLRWSSSLEADAQAWANRCVFEHANGVGSGEGENLAWGYADPASFIDAFYQESSQYSYGASQPANWAAVAHFTQASWGGQGGL